MGNNGSKGMIHKSSYPDVSIPKKDIASFCFDAWENHLDKELGVYGTRRVTYREVKTDAVKFACALSENYGVKKGDVVAMYAPNSVEWIVAFYGILAAGGVVTTINPAYTPAEVTHQFHDSDPKIAIVSHACESKILEVKHNIPSVKHVLVICSDKEEDINSEHVKFDAVVQQSRDDFKGPKIGHMELAVLPYSSGTTGVSKGVMLTHYNLVANCVQNVAALGKEFTDPNGSLVAVLPFFHIYGMQIFLLNALFTGCKISIMPKFDPMEFLRILGEEKVTIAFVVPPIINFLAKHPAVDKFVDKFKGSLKCVLSGAAPLGKELGEAVSIRLGCTIKQGYGMTEMSPVTHVTPEHMAQPENAGSIGTLLPNTYMKIVKSDGQLAAVGEVGEMWIKGPQVMKGYLNQKEATDATLDKQGWLHTGDIGVVDERGMCSVVDRLKELIKVKGMQVAPAEVEDALHSHPSISDVAVIGKPSDERTGELVKCFIVVKDSCQPPTLAELQEFAAQSLAPYKVPGEVEVVSEIPKSASGKILRRVLRDRV